MPIQTLADASDIHFRVRGRGANAFFLHAVTVDSTMWLDQLGGLAEIRRCIAPDLPGHGLSDPDPAREQPTSGQFRRMLEVFDAQTKGPVDLVGFSAGGLIAALICQARPNRCRSLTMVSSLIPKTAAEPEDSHKELALLLMNEGKQGFYRRQAGYVMLPDAPLFVRARYRSMLEQTRFESIVSFMADTPSEAFPGLAASLKLPILIVNGERDIGAKITDPDLTGPNVTRDIIPGAARLAPIEQPAAVNQSLRRFWTKVG